MPTSLLEPEYADAYHAWKADPSPASNARFLSVIHPAIVSATKAHTGGAGPLVLGRARRLALDAARRYDPSRARLSTHLTRQLEGLKRIQGKQDAPLALPERMALDRQHLGRLTGDLTESLGREPSVGELAEHSGLWHARIRRVRALQSPVAEGSLEAASGQVFGGSTPVGGAGRSSSWEDLVYDDLAPADQRVVDLHRAGHSNQAIARQLGVTPGAVSQRKARIQALLDREADLSPFGS